MINKLKEMRKGAGEDGFTLIELMVVVLIIGVLAAIAIPIFLNQQNEAINGSVRSDVRNTVTNVATALVTDPTAAAVTNAWLEAADFEVVETEDNQVVVAGTYNSYTVTGANGGTGFGYQFSSTSGEYVNGTASAVSDTAITFTANP